MTKEEQKAFDKGYATTKKEFYWDWQVQEDKEKLYFPNLIQAYENGRNKGLKEKYGI